LTVPPQDLPQQAGSIETKKKAGQATQNDDAKTMLKYQVTKSDGLNRAAMMKQDVLVTICVFFFTCMSYSELSKLKF